VRILINLKENRLRIPMFLTATRRLYSNEEALKIAASASGTVTKTASKAT